MSAGPAPPNPHTPRGNSNTIKSSFISRKPGLVITGGALAAATLAYILVPPSPRKEPIGSFRTPGVQNIEKAYTNAGATATHTKAYGGTVQGNHKDGMLREGGGSGAPNKVSPFEKDGMGNDQRASGTKVDEMFNKTNLGSAAGK